MPSQSTLDSRGESTHDHRRVPANVGAHVNMEISGATHPGKVRSNNEDQFLIAKLAKSMKVCMSSLPEVASRLRSDEEGYLLVVADGMGGAAAGETASTLAIETVEDFALNTFKWFLHLGDPEESVLVSELREVLESADQAVINRARSDPKLHGMGTTLTMAYSIGADLFLVHAGDSRAYLFHGGGLEQLTNDHTLVQILVDNGALSKEDAKHHKRRNVVTNVIGGPSRGVHAEIRKLKVADGDVLLLCSDGLTEAIANDAIAGILSNFEHPEDACKRLIDLTLAHGAPDNVTVVVARYGVPEA